MTEQQTPYQIFKSQMAAIQAIVYPKRIVAEGAESGFRSATLQLEGKYPDPGSPGQFIHKLSPLFKILDVPPAELTDVQVLFAGLQLSLLSDLEVARAENISLRAQVDEYGLKMNEADARHEAEVAAHTKTVADANKKFSDMVTSKDSVIAAKDVEIARLTERLTTANVKINAAQVALSANEV